MWKFLKWGGSGWRQSVGVRTNLNERVGSRLRVNDDFLNQDHPTKSCAQTNRTETWENLIIIIITIISLCITIIIVNIQRSVSKRDYSHVQIHVNKIMTPYYLTHDWTRWLYSVQIVHHIQQIEMAVNMTEAPFKRLSNDSLVKADTNQVTQKPVPVPSQTSTQTHGAQNKPDLDCAKTILFACRIGDQTDSKWTNSRDKSRWIPAGCISTRVWSMDMSTTYDDALHIFMYVCTWTSFNSDSYLRRLNEIWPTYFQRCKSILIWSWIAKFRCPPSVHQFAAAFAAAC